MVDVVMEMLKGVICSLMMGRGAVGPVSVGSGSFLGVFNEGGPRDLMECRVCAYTGRAWS